MKLLTDIVIETMKTSLKDSCFRIFWTIQLLIKSEIFFLKDVL